MTTEFFGLSDEMLTGGGGVTIPFHGFKDGAHKFRLLPPFAPSKLFHQVDLHWGFTDQNNRKKALQCSKKFDGKCAICELVEKLDQAKVLYEQAGKLAEMNDVLKKISDIRRKPTYLWNILFGDEHKVLQLSWNGHDPLLKKIQFYWQEKKVNLTDPKNNWLIHVERSGTMAKTRYVYEPLDNAVKSIEVPKLFDLTKIYKVTPYSELLNVVNSGQVQVTSNKAPDVNDFYAAANKNVPSQAQTQAATVIPSVPTAAPVVTSQPTTPPVQMSQSQEADISTMLAILNKSAG